MSDKDSTVAYELQRREKELEAVRRISQALFQHLPLDELVEKALSVALEVVNAEAGSVILANYENKELVFLHAIGSSTPQVGKTFAWDKGIAGWVFQRGEAVVTEDAKQDHRHFQGIDEITGFTTHDMIALPLKSWEGNPIGVLEIMNKRGGKLDQDDVKVLTIISALTAISIEETYLIEKAKLSEILHLLGDISDDVKNFLTPILNGTWLLQDGLNEVFSHLLPETVNQFQVSQKLSKDITDMIRKNAGRIQDRVGEIADCVKGMSTPLNIAPCSLSVVANEVIKTLGLLAQEKDLTIINENLERLPPIQGDERRLFIAFYNLVNNAIPEVPKGGTITLKGTYDESEAGLGIDVTDTGRGMPAHIQEALSTDRPMGQKTKGIGLGLEIVKGVINSHGGRINVESEPGKGTAFHIFLPLQPPISSQAFPRTKPASPGR
jgi:signal transduction histidine kinase